MKKLLLVGLGASLWVSNVAHAQQTFSFSTSQRYGLTLPPLPTVSAAAGLESVEGKPDVFTLKRGRYDAKELMEVLAAKTGGKAIFADGFKTRFLDLFPSLQGTVPELLAKMANYGVAAGKLGQDWVFVPVQNQSRLSSKLHFDLDLRRYLPLPPAASLLPKPDNFNINSKPGENLPSDATPFEFNGERLYLVPLHPEVN